MLDQLLHRAEPLVPVLVLAIQQGGAHRRAKEGHFVLHGRHPSPSLQLHPAAIGTATAKVSDTIAWTKVSCSCSCLKTPFWSQTTPIFRFRAPTTTTTTVVAVVGAAVFGRHRSAVRPWGALHGEALDCLLVSVFETERNAEVFREHLGWVGNYSDTVRANRDGWMMQTEQNAEQKQNE